MRERTRTWAAGVRDNGPGAGDRGPRPVVVAAVLTFGTGVVDVLALVHLGGVFASVMTGNLALLGLALARADGAAAASAVVAVLGYVVGVAVGSRTTGVRAPGSPFWPHRATVVLSLELAVLGGLAAGWVATGADPQRCTREALLAAAATAMGLQGAAVRALGAPLATTYLTGSLTALVAARAVGTGGAGHGPGIASLVGAVAGAVFGGLVLRGAPVAAPLLAVASLAATLVVVIARRRVLRPRVRHT